MADDEVRLTKPMVKTGLSSFTIIPSTLSYCYTRFEYINKNITNIDVLRSYPNLQIVDLSNNLITDMSPLEDLPFLQILKLHHNKISKLLEIFPGSKLSDDSPGVGSLLEYADVSYNKIHEIPSINHHKYLHTLLLQHNQISFISGINQLFYLSILDLSNNHISKIYGIDNLPLKELYLSNNNIKIVENLSTLSQLRIIDLSHNEIMNIDELGKLPELQRINLEQNFIDGLSKFDQLSQLIHLTELNIIGNPLLKRPHSKLRVIYRLRYLITLNCEPVSIKSKVDSIVLYGDDVENRQNNLEKHIPDAIFENLRPPFVDAHDDTEPLYEEVLPKPPEIDEELVKTLSEHGSIGQLDKSISIEGSIDPLNQSVNKQSSIDHIDQHLSSHESPHLPNINHSIENEDTINHDQL